MSRQGGLAPDNDLSLGTVLLAVVQLLVKWHGLPVSDQLKLTVHK